MNGRMPQIPCLEKSAGFCVYDVQLGETGLLDSFHEY